MSVQAVEPLELTYDHIGLRQLDPQFLEAVPASERRLAERLAVATRHRVPPGAWFPEGLSEPDGPDPHAILVLEGLVARDVMLAGRASGCLFGPGDVLRPWRRPERTVSTTSMWTCCAPGAVVAVLGDSFNRVARKWPGVSSLIRDRLDEQLDAATLQTAIVSLPRAEQRVLALMWHLADRWGAVTPAGVVVPLHLTHALIGRIVAARRPTVTLALRTLGESGLLTRGHRGEWCLAHDSHLEIGSATARACVPVIAASG